MKEERITVIIDAEGKMSAKTSGLKGEACIEELFALMEEIAEISEDQIEHTREYRESDPRAGQSIDRKQRLGGGSQ